MILTWPLNNIQLSPPIAPTPDSVYISQRFGHVWIAQFDMVLNGVLLKKGDNVYKRLFGWEGHNGIDIAAPKGTPIYAPIDGYVVEATDKTSGYGIRVCLLNESDGKEYFHVFGHLDDFVPLPEMAYNYFSKVKYVRRGEQIGHVDSTGISTGHHLHWGLHIYKNGQKLNSDNGFGGAINPEPFIRDKFMELFQIEGEQTLVLKNLDGKYLVIATAPELYPYVDRVFGIGQKRFPFIPKAEVEANKVGQANAGLSFIV